jgi:crotonobetainyl-CoA:carnitine CoA-transferase CaiB-like acyl-CoA transferase
VLGPLARQILGDMGADVIIGETESAIAQFANTTVAATP